MTGLTYAPLLNPLGFAADTLMARGALVEGGLAVLPAELASALDVPPELTLTDVPGGAPPGVGVSCALGSALLEKLIRAARATPPCARLRFDVEAPRVSQATSLGARFVVRNALVEVDSAYATEVTYAVLYVAWSAEADDRHAGVAQFVVAAKDGGQPSPALAEQLDLRSPGPALHDGRSEEEPTHLTDVAMRVLGRTAERVVTPRAAPLVEGVRRRHHRDHTRIAEYFSALLAEVRTSRRKVEPAAVAAKIAQLEGERSAKLAELDERYAVRTTLEPAALALVTVPVVEVRLRLRRRKATGEIVVRLPPLSQELDLVACAACARPTSRPAVCDVRLHPLCEVCVPTAQGRPSCAACSEA